MGRFSHNLARLRTERKLSQEELAKRAGCSQGAISQYENGDTMPSLVIATKLAEALGTTCEELVYGKE